MMWSKLKKLGAVTLAALCMAGLTGCGKSNGGGGVKQNTAKFTTRQIKMLVPWNAGGSADIAVRTLQPYLEKEMGTKITVVNMPGANGWIAWNELLKAKPDGYTIAQMNLPTVYAGWMDPQQKRNASLDSFMFVANEVTDTDCLVVKANDDRFKDLKGFLEYAKTHEILSGDNGVGTNTHLLEVNLTNNFKDLKLKQVHQTGWANNYSALLGGHIDVSWGGVGNVLQGYKDGEVRVLCTFADKRSSLMPDVPTFNELMPGYNITSPSDRGFALPKGVDPAIYKRWVEAMDKAIHNEEFQKKMAALGQNINYIGGDEYTAYAKKEEGNMKKFADVLGWNK